MNDWRSNAASLFYRKQDEELLTLCDGILKLVGEGLASQSESMKPLAGGITRLGKFEAIHLESRFYTRPSSAGLDWLKDSLRLRMRRGFYASGALLEPQPGESDQDFKATVTILHTRLGRTRRYKMTLKSKRPGQVTISQPVAC